MILKNNNQPYCTPNSPFVWIGGKLMVILPLLILLGSLHAFSQAYKQKIPDEYGFKVNNGDIVPNFEINLTDGSYTTIQKLRGNVVMIQFTASWCGVCRKEMPHIESEIWQKHKSNPNFKLFGIDLKESKDKTIAFQKDIKVTYPLALDLDGSIFNKFTVPNAGVTRNIIIDKDGKIAYMTRLFKEEEFKEMVDVIEELLKK